MSIGVLCVTNEHSQRQTGRSCSPVWRCGLTILAIWLSAFYVNAQQVATTQQSASSNAGKPPTQISEVVLYHQFFRHFLFLDHQAALHSRQQILPQGEDQNSYQKKLQFDPDQFGKVRRAATTTEQAVASLDAKAKEIVLAFRTQHPQVSASSPLPPPPAELATLQKQRDDLIQNEIAQLRGSLGAQASQQLDSLLKTQFAPHLRIAFVGTPRSHDPAAKPLTPFERIR